MTQSSVLTLSRFPELRWSTFWSEATRVSLRAFLRAASDPILSANAPGRSECPIVRAYFQDIREEFAGQSPFPLQKCVDLAMVVKINCLFWMKATVFPPGDTAKCCTCPGTMRIQRALPLGSSEMT